MAQVAARSSAEARREGDLARSEGDERANVGGSHVVIDCIVETTTSGSLPSSALAFTEAKHVVPSEGLEPPTPCSEDKCSVR
jgi:hypothetical protein